MARRVNLVNFNSLENPLMFDQRASKRAFFFVMVAFIVSFAGIIIGIWLGVVGWLESNLNPAPKTIYPGVILIVQNLLIFVRYAPKKKTF